MSVLQAAKEAIGIDSHDPDFRCEECGRKFEYDNPDAGWSRCPECGNDTESKLTSLS